MRAIDALPRYAEMCGYRCEVHAREHSHVLRIVDAIGSTELVGLLELRDAPVDRDGVAGFAGLVTRAIERFMRTGIEWREQGCRESREVHLRI